MLRQPSLAVGLIHHVQPAAFQDIIKPLSDLMDIPVGLGSLDHEYIPAIRRVFQETLRHQSPHQFIIKGDVQVAV